MAEFPRAGGSGCPALPLGQFCLVCAPVGYTEQDVLYRWTDSRAEVTISQDLELSQFDLIRTPVGERTDRNTRGQLILSRNVEGPDTRLGDRAPAFCFVLLD